MTQKRLGVTAVVDETGSFTWVLLQMAICGECWKKIFKLIQVKAADIMTTNPKTIGPDELAVEALNILRKNEITQLVVTDNGIYLGVIHLHDLLKEGFI